jgi:hypothetical protein
VQWSEINPFVWVMLALGALMVLIALVQTHRSKLLRERLEILAREMGWSEVRGSNFFTTTVQGIWNGYSVRVRRIARQKNAPERVLSNIRVQAPARLIVTRRQHTVFGGRPMTLFGPPIVEVALASQFWVRADEITLAERLMRSSAAALLDRTLQSRFDILRLGGDDLLIQRISSRDPDEVARLAREELELLRAVIDALSLRP